jgi:hypothetical protein
MSGCQTGSEYPIVCVNRTNCIPFVSVMADGLLVTSADVRCCLQCVSKTMARPPRIASQECRSQPASLKGQGLAVASATMADRQRQLSLERSPKGWVQNLTVSHCVVCQIGPDCIPMYFSDASDGAQSGSSYTRPHTKYSSSFSMSATACVFGQPCR